MKLLERWRGEDWERRIASRQSTSVREVLSHDRWDILSSATPEKSREAQKALHMVVIDLRKSLLTNTQTEDVGGVLGKKMVKEKQIRLNRQV